jgi:hypothetical protein
MDSFTSELVNAIKEVIYMLSEMTSYDDRELCAMRLEVLAENSLTHDVIPLEVVDHINEAVQLLKRGLGMERRYEPYQAPSDGTVTRRGRPRFSITQEQLIFFKGKLCCKLYSIV